MNVRALESFPGLVYIRTLLYCTEQRLKSFADAENRFANVFCDFCEFCAVFCRYQSYFVLTSCWRCPCPRICYRSFAPCDLQLSTTRSAIIWPRGTFGIESSSILSSNTCVSMKYHEIIDKFLMFSLLWFLESNSFVLLVLRVSQGLCRLRDSLKMSIKRLIAELNAFSLVFRLLLTFIFSHWFRADFVHTLSI